AFVSGADVRFLARIDSPETGMSDARDAQAVGDRIQGSKKPVVCAMNGVAFGGGMEMALCCTARIVRADLPVLGAQPEVKLGIIPGAGGTQRLPRAVGKAKAMDLCLTGRLMDAAEAEQAGLVARIYPADRLLEETLAAARTIAGFSLPVAMMVKEAVNRAFESSLAEGLLFERRSFHAAFALDDQKEGMAAFLAKRPPSFTDR
ncbi:MAG: enoyl-CoA hydratase/isomerase family protein, partial [Rhodocyclaceae bacterium]|nr:enoyl-CoA hydratase/isomerase family protein [Rhodocyclaceae bacterium]